MKKAIVIGSTGMVGLQLIELLLLTDEYTEIVSLVRRKGSIKHPKLKEHIVDFDNMDTWGKLLQGDVLFSCMGTTIGKAKTKANQYKIDYTYQYNIAEKAAANGVETYILISSTGANSKSFNFYTQMKGKLDDAVQKLGFKTIHILRPAQLYGNRQENRTGEKIGLSIMFAFNKIGILKHLKPIHAREVAQAMINIAEIKKTSIITSGDLFRLL